MSFEKFIQGKNEVVVGSASYMKDEKYGSSIDSHDIVVRINRGCEVILGNEKSIGNRTDVLYSCLIEQKENAGSWNASMLIDDYKVKYLCTTPASSVAGISHVSSLHKMVNKEKYLDLANRLPCRIIDSQFFTRIAREINCRPTTGYIAIYDILNYQPATLTVHGFDFFYSGWFPEYKKGTMLSMESLWTNTLKSKRHKHKNMWEHAKKNLLNNKKVIIDDHLKKVLSINSWWAN